MVVYMRKLPRVNKEHDGPMVRLMPPPGSPASVSGYEYGACPENHHRSGRPLDQSGIQRHNGH